MHCSQLLDNFNQNQKISVDITHIVKRYKYKTADLWSYISNWITLLEDNQIGISVELTDYFYIDLKKCST